MKQILLLCAFIMSITSYNMHKFVNLKKISLFNTPKNNKDNFDYDLINNIILNNKDYEFDKLLEDYNELKNKCYGEVNETNELDEIEEEMMQLLLRIEELTNKLYN